jgi:hypothetical protein
MSLILLDCARQTSDVELMQEVLPTTIRYIKLGPGGAWEAALDRGHIPWGNDGDRHLLDLAGDWDAVHAAYRAQNSSSATATGYTNEARAFFDGDPDALWITFTRGRLWWALADPTVHTSDASHSENSVFYRTVRGGWQDTDVAGASLELERLSTRLTQLSAYQRTICGLTPDQKALCLRYINAEPDPLQTALATSRAEMQRHLKQLIQRLPWRDFEQLIDLALARTGWLRISGLGGTAKDIDLVVEQAFTRERIAVQIKSTASQQVVDDYARRLNDRPAGERIMLVCHSPIGELAAPATRSDRRLELLLDDAVAELSINAGLVDWIAARSR